MRLPRINNTDPVEEIVTVRYSDEELLSLIEGGYGGGWKYTKLPTLAKDYKIECVRDPRIWNEKYLPYIVLLSDTGRYMIIYYDNWKVYDQRTSKYVQLKQMIVGIDYLPLLPDREALEETLVEMSEKQATKEEWYECLRNNSAGVPLNFESYEYEYLPLRVQEGVLVAVLSENGSHLIRTEFFPNEEIFAETGKINTAQDNGHYWLTPILPMDKEGSQKIFREP